VSGSKLGTFSEAIGVISHPLNGVLIDEQFPRRSIDRMAPTLPTIQQSRFPTTPTGRPPRSGLLISMTTKAFTFCRATDGVMFCRKCRGKNAVRV
jgi:hypothetical protein